MPTQNETKPFPDKPEFWVSWFFAAVGLIYGCGFLIVFTFFQSWGVDSVVLVQARYIHVGFLYLMACLVIIVPIWWILWPLRNSGPSLTMKIRDGLLQKSLRKRFLYFTFDPLGRLLFPKWELDPTHGIHMGMPVVVSMILILWSFIMLVIFAPSHFGRLHPRLAIFNFLFPMLVLALALMADLFKEGELSNLQKNVLRYSRCFLRVWWIVAGALFGYFFWTSKIFDNEALTKALAWRFFSPPCGIILFLWLVLFCFPCRGDARGKNMLTRIAVSEWMLYAIQWAFVIGQCWLFIWSIKTTTLELSLGDVLMGRGYFENLHNAIHGGHGSVFPHGAIYFVFLIALIGFFIMRNAYRFKQIEDRTHRKGMFLSVAVIIIPLFYISMLSFALTVYPYIPYEKGGADYTKERPVSITFDTNAITPTGILITLPQKLLTEDTSNVLILLDENDNTIFLADRTEGGGPEEWRTGASKPVIFEVNRKAIACLVQMDIDSKPKPQHVRKKKR
jgi:hypothetical protein